MRTPCRSPAYQVLSLLGLSVVLACGDSDPVSPPTSEFPRAFTARSTECVSMFRSRFGSEDSVQVFIEEHGEGTVQASTDEYVAGPALFIHRKVFDAVTGDLIRIEDEGEVRPDAVEGTWKVALTPAKDWAWNAVGVGDGDLTGRSIEFRMYSISDCGYESAGTIR